MSDQVVPPPRRPVESRDPATGALLRSYPSATPEEVRAAIARARGAQPAWAARSPRERAAVLARFGRILHRRRHEVAALVTQENGKPYSQAMIADALVTGDFVNWTVREAPRFLARRWRGVYGLAMWRKRVWSDPRPLGVIGIISPWNYPFFLPTVCVLPALACGNAVVLKPSEFTPESAALLAAMMREAGLPEGVLQVIQGDGVTGAALVRGGVNKVLFTGSEVAGRSVAIACAEQLIPCSLELGGSDAALVLHDADVRTATEGIAWGRFLNGGQTCVAPKRIYVEAPIWESFVAAMQERLRELKVGAGNDESVDVGPVIRASAVETLRAQRDDAIAQGASAISASLEGVSGDGHFFPPTLLTGVTSSMRVVNEETFGPLLPLVKVQSEEEAIRLANDSPFGLSASVWTTDRARGFAVAKRIEAGTVLINDSVTVVGMASIPYGGVKRSGVGRMHGEAGLAECVQETPIVDDWFPRWAQPWWFGRGATSWKALDDYAEAAHGEGLWSRLRGLPGVMKMMFAKRGADR